jgi:hypothetical protein
MSLQADLQDEIDSFCSQRGIKYEVSSGKATIELSQNMTWMYSYFFTANFGILGRVKVYPIFVVSLVVSLGLGYFLRKSISPPKK